MISWSFLFDFLFHYPPSSQGWLSRSFSFLIRVAVLIQLIWTHLNRWLLISVFCVTSLMLIVLSICFSAKTEGSKQTEKHWKKHQSIEQAKANYSQPTFVNNNECVQLGLAKRQEPQKSRIAAMNYAWTHFAQSLPCLEISFLSICHASRSLGN